MLDTPVSTKARQPGGCTSRCSSQNCRCSCAGMMLEALPEALKRPVSAPTGLGYAPARKLVILGQGARLVPAPGQEAIQPVCGACRCQQRQSGSIRVL